MARVALLLLAAFAARAQSVEIAFTNSVTHAPIPELALILKGPSSFAETTGPDGMARFPATPPGDYSLVFQAPGFLIPRSVYRPFRVGDEPVRLAFELTPWARVSGRVLDPEGKPVPSARVFLDSLRVGGASQVTTDPAGRFSITTPFTGRYTLLATAPNSDAELAPTFYPAAIAAADAESFSLRPGAELSSYEIRLRSVPVHRLGGVVHDDAGNPAAGVSVRLVDDRRVTAERKTTAAEDGSFSFDAVREGAWRISAAISRGDVELRAGQRLTIARRDLDRVQLRLARPFSLRATIEWDGPPSPAPDPVYVALYPEPLYPSGEGKRQPDGSLVFAAVYPGRYDIQVLGARPGYYLDSVRLGDRDALGHSVELVEGSPPLRVVFKFGAARIHVRVEHGAGASVVAIPQEDALLSTSFSLDTSTDPAGLAEVIGLRPGDYYVFAFDVFESAALRDPAFVTRLVPRAVKVRVEKGETATVALKVTPWPE